MSNETQAKYPSLLRRLLIKVHAVLQFEGSSLWSANGAFATDDRR